MSFVQPGRPTFRQGLTRRTVDAGDDNTATTNDASAAAPAAAPKIVKDRNKTPQELLSEFWEDFVTKKAGKVTTIFPPSLYANLLPPLERQGSYTAANAAEGYESAARQCRERVRRIVQECHRTNLKFTDPDFDIEIDHGDQKGNCLYPLVRSDDSRYEFRGSVHRVDWIYEKPAFTIDGFSTSDIMQGSNGDCWWLAAVATLCSDKRLLEKVCVARDEECGVYGFVFFHQGEWISTVIDDNLYLSSPDYRQDYDEYDSSGKKAREYRKRYQTGSEALYFAKCCSPNETWLPLLEKAYAKIHGDYTAIAGGDSGEGVEDMTGGVTTTMMFSRILSKEKLWRELTDSNGNFVFAASAIGTGGADTKNGLALGHAYSVLRAVEEEDEDGKKFRLVLIRNPWGERSWSGLGEWSGPWSDGAKEWTPYWLAKLDHKFGDDGIFWMSFDDMMAQFMYLHRTRLFDDQWTVVQQWTSINISWVTGYMQTKFLVEIKKGGPVVLVLTQLDNRYFQGLEGQYTFTLHFLLREDGSPSAERIVRARSEWESRSVSAEIDLNPGRYEVIPKIQAERYKDLDMVDDVVREWAEKNPQKLRQIGMNYDLAHAKAGIENEEAVRLEKKKKAEEKDKLKKNKEDEKKKKKKAKKEKEKEKKRKAKELEKKRRSIAKLAGQEKPAQKANETGQETPEAQNGSANSEQVPGQDGLDKGKITQEIKPSDQPARVMLNDNAENGRHDEAIKIETEQTQETDQDQDQGSTSSEEEEDGGDDDEDDEKEEDEDAVDAIQAENYPWNAVCVVGLRVYAKDPTLKITLAKPKDNEEAALLDADGTAPAGATT